MSLVAVAVSLEPVAPESVHSSAFVELERVTHTYGRGERQVHALSETTLRIEKGDFGAQLYVENLFDAKYFANAYEKAFYSGVQVEPSYRVIGGSVGFKF